MSQQHETDVTLSTLNSTVTIDTSATTTSVHVKNKGRAGDDAGDDDDDDEGLNHHDNNMMQPSSATTYTGMTLKERRELYGDIYDTDEALWDDIQKYVKKFL